MGVNSFATLTEALESLKKRGFTESIVVREDGATDGSGRKIRPDETTVVEYHRFEGTSNPEDMSVVYALELANGKRATLVDAYGPYASPYAAEFIQKLRMKEGLR